jgi:hypothetical protein
VEAASAVVTAALTAVTLVSPGWIESIFPVDPDGGSGLLEWTIVITLAVITLMLSVLARLEWRRPATQPSH